MRMDKNAQAGVTRQAYFDAQLATLMLREGITVIVTENVADFAKLAGIRTIDPFA